MARDTAPDIGVRAHLAGENAFSLGVLYAQSDCDALAVEERAPQSERPLAEFLIAIQHQLPVKVVINNNSLGPELPAAADRPGLAAQVAIAPLSQVSIASSAADAPQAEGPLDWNETTLALVTATAGARSGRAGNTVLPRSAWSSLTCSRAPSSAAAPSTFRAAAAQRRERFATLAVLPSLRPRFPPSTWHWDLKTRLLELPLAGLLGRARERVPVYGSGGLTSYDDKQIREQLYR